MENPDIIKFIKKSFTGKNFAFIFFSSLLSLLIIVLIGVGLIWHYRANVFGYFAKEYLEKMQDSSNKDEAKIATEKIIEKQSIFSQDTFVIDAVKKTNPAVVSIIIYQEVPK